MKYILTILVFISLNASGTNYYFSNSGNDANAGTQAAPFATITKFNTLFSTLAAGDNIYFKRGDVFYGQLTVTASGTAAAPITVGAYGSGALPVISGMTTLTWTDTGSNIWEASCAACDDKLNVVVTSDTVFATKGRYPNTGWLTYESFSTNTSITDNQLTASPNWTGAEIVIKKAAYIIDRNNISNHSTTVITYTSYEPLSIQYYGQNNFGYFITGDIRTLDVQGEWFFDKVAKKVKMYSVGSPTNVKVATKNKLLLIQYQDYVIVENLRFYGANFTAIDMAPNITHMTIRNCEIQNVGEVAIYIASCPYAVIQDNFIRDVLNNGIEMDYGNTNSTITGNTVKRIGLIRGRQMSGDSKGTAIIGQGNTMLISQNVVDSTGFNGIHFKNTSNVTVQKNFVNHAMQIKSDGGAIYTYLGGRALPKETNKIIEDNIVLNSFGAMDGTATESENYGHGIYLDGNDANITVRRNTAAYCTYGIYVNDGQDLVFDSNTLYKNNQIQAFFFGSYDTLSARITFRHNITISGAAPQKSFQIATYTDQWPTGAINTVGSAATINDNFHSRRSSEASKMYGVLNGTATGYSLAGWTTATAYDAASTEVVAGITADAELFFYNATNSPAVKTFSGTYKNPSGVSYTNNITLPAYSSVVLFRSTTQSSGGGTIILKTKIIIR